ncbi:universal stress protein [Aeromicrobium sp. IC_218]|uniref:universal stress protein n=1 Tax=Aeromicrobium sp. IC_218 TaxID=2545468 RepID=UPI00103F1C36|nr:universal stress protein [Aeromicrobium sp. IC_218]TCJ00210.1 universal stress protein [Aeromicrobium sp. IC_218]
MSRFVVGVDGSPQSGAALEWAVERARRGGEHLELVHVYETPVVADFFGYQAVLAASVVDDLAAAGHDLVEAGRARVEQLAPDVPVTVRVDSGHPATVLVEASRSADLVVVGRRGLGWAASVLVGSVAHRVTVQSSCPVAVVGEDGAPDSGPIVVGVDGSATGTQALRWAVGEATVRGTSVRAVAAYDVLHPAFAADPELAEQLRKDVESEARATIASVLDEQGEPAVPIDLVLESQRAAEAILGAADDAQLVVVGTHGKGAVRRMLLGSTSRFVLDEADRPVVIVPTPRDG